MSRSLPVVEITRALVPGTTMMVPAPETRASAGDHVVVVFCDSYRRARIGTEALVRARHDNVLTTLQVEGRRLVEVDRDDDFSPVTPVAHEDAPPEQMDAVASALRRYMAVRAEAGIGGDVHVELSPDSEAASHQVASLLHVTWPEIQEVLEAGGTSARLERARLVLERETVLLTATMGRRG
jgi:hypothetical protein